MGKINFVPLPNRYKLLREIINANKDLPTISAETKTNTCDHDDSIIYFQSTGVVGNAFVIVVLASSKTLRRSLVNIFLINQSSIDLGASLMAILTSPDKANAAGIPNNLAGKSFLRTKL